MKRTFFWLGMLVMILAFGIAVLGACKSAPKAYAVIEEPLTPDANSAVIYFFGTRSSGNIWDGETPIGSFSEGPLVAGIAYKTTPGEHYFMANASNWVVMRADLEPNKRYYLRISPLPSPPFTQLIAMVRLNKEEGDAWMQQVKHQPISFTDEWRAEFAQGKRLQGAQENLQSAKNKSMEVDLSGINGY